VCGYKNQELKLSDRECVCFVCGARQDRDIKEGKTCCFMGLLTLRTVGLDRSKLRPVEGAKGSVEDGE